MQLPPKDRVGATTDVFQQRLHVLCRALARLSVELEVSVAPIDLPLNGLLGVAELRDRELDPLSAASVRRRPRFKDCDVPVGDFTLDSHLVEILRRHTIPAPLTDTELVRFGYRHDHHSLRASAYCRYPLEDGGGPASLLGVPELRWPAIASMSLSPSPKPETASSRPRERYQKSASS